MDPPENRNYICISLDQYPAVTSRIDTARFAISWKLVVDPAEFGNSLEQYSVVIRGKIPRGSPFHGNLWWIRQKTGTH